MNTYDEIYKRSTLVDHDSQILRDFVASPFGRSIAAAAGISLEFVDQSLANLESTIRNLASSIECLGAFGWSTNSGGAPMDVQREALRLVLSGSLDEANRVLTVGWEGLADRVVGQVQGLHFGDDALCEIAKGRGLLIEKAITHHRNGEFEAAILILLTQIDGIVMDMTVSVSQPRGKYFFKTKKGVSATDDETVVGIDGALNTVRDWFCGPILETQFGGNLSRHAIAHGRQLEYGTRENSARCIALLAGVIEWVRPWAERLALQRNDERLERYAGSDEVDEYGRRLDRRGFSDARLRLKLLCAAQSHFHDCNSRFASRTESERFGVKGADLVIETSQHDCWSGYTTSDSGIVFGLVQTQTGFRYFEGKTAPPGLESADWLNEETPNWSGDVY